MNKNHDDIELSPFQIRHIKILTHLFEHNAVTDDVVEYLRQSELDYFSLVEKYKILDKKINIDEKTNILKFKNDYLTNIIKTASRIYYGINQTNYPVSIVRFDIDDFSRFNNKYGHDIGDIVLIGIANILRENSRPTDYVIRFGGEEFDVLLPSTDIDGAKKYLDKIYSEVEKFYVEHDGERLKVTVSAGVSTMVYAFGGKRKVDKDEIDQYFKVIQSEADDALYEAKFSGKNQYCIYSGDKHDDYCRIRRNYNEK